MENLFEYLIIGAVFTLLTYGLIMQIQQTISIQKTNKRLVYKHKRTLIGHYVTSISFLGFFTFLMLNITNILPSNYTVISCFMFLVIFLIAKFGIIPKKYDRLISR